VPDALGPYMAPITALISIPFTVLISNDAFYFGMLPVLAHSAEFHGIDAMQMTPIEIEYQSSKPTFPRTPKSVKKAIWNSPSSLSAGRRVTGQERYRQAIHLLYGTSRTMAALTLVGLLAGRAGVWGLLSLVR
jgi:hypothetical protein